MRNVETMTEARAGIAEVLAKIQAVLPEDRLPEFTADSKKLLDLADTAIAAQAKLDSQKADVQGDRYVKPEPAKDLADIITHQRKGDEIHYSRHDATGAYQTVAFIDRGKEIDVRDWNNTPASTPPSRLRRRSGTRCRSTGATNTRKRQRNSRPSMGTDIANPELQDRIAELRRDRGEPAAERESEAPKHADDRSPSSSGPRGQAGRRQGGGRASSDASGARDCAGRRPGAHRGRGRSRKPAGGAGRGHARAQSGRGVSADALPVSGTGGGRWGVAARARERSLPAGARRSSSERRNGEAQRSAAASSHRGRGAAAARHRNRGSAQSGI